MEACALLIYFACGKPKAADKPFTRQEYRYLKRANKEEAKEKNIKRWNYQLDGKRKILYTYG
jgi:hypothetical protein